jgi:hypothetical protein
MLKSKQDETITSIKSKINEINKLKKVVLKSNDFKANMSFERDSFGILALNCSSISLLDSKILSQDQIFDLIELCEFNACDTWTLLILRKS